jgi:hypothetical protein
MAKQAGDFFIEGTIDDLTFYKMDGKYYVRMKSSLTKRKFWKSKAFERSRESCKRFSEGNKLASKLYKMIEKEKRVYTLYCFLKKRAILLLKEGKSLTEAEEVLTDYLQEFGAVEDGNVNVISKNKDVDSSKYVDDTKVAIVSSASTELNRQHFKADRLCSKSIHLKPGRLFLSSA